MFDSTFFFDGGDVAFKKASISYSPLNQKHGGSRHFVIGKNGSGKSVLTRCISGVVPSVFRAKVGLTGRIGVTELFNGRNVGPPSISVLPQYLREFLLGLSVAEEIRISIAKNSVTKDSRYQSIIHGCGIKEFSQRSVWDLSDGERQRVAIACLLIGSSGWIVFDEWKSHLDQKWISKIDTLIDNLVENGLSTLELFSMGDLNDESTCTLHTHVNRFLVDKEYTLDERQAGLKKLFKLLQLKKIEDFKLNYSKGIVRRGFKRKIPSLLIRSGEIISVEGPNGSGKTTLLRNIHNAVRKRFIRKADLIISDPALQLVGRTVGGLVNAVFHNKKIFPQVAFLIANVLGVELDSDPLSFNHAVRKLAAVLLGACSSRPILLVDEPFTGLDEDSMQICKLTLSAIATRLGKAVVVANPFSSADRGLPCTSFQLST